MDMILRFSESFEHQAFHAKILHSPSHTELFIIYYNSAITISPVKRNILLNNMFYMYSVFVTLLQKHLT